MIMYRRFSIHVCIMFFFLFLFPIRIVAHGFGAGTLIKAGNQRGYWAIEQIARLVAEGKEQKIVSYDPLHNRWFYKFVTSAGQSTLNCYVRLAFDQHCSNDIICTPSQEFYVIDSQSWVPAYRLKSGDRLLSACNGYGEIKNVGLVKKSIGVYSIEVEEPHTYQVGAYNVVTHNMVIPCSAGLVIPIGSGCGGAIGTILGPIGVAGGIFIGTLIGIAVKKLRGKKIQNYRFAYDFKAIEKEIQQGNSARVASPSGPKKDDDEDNKKSEDAKATPINSAPEAQNLSPELGEKLKYIFGKASGSAHNIERSTTMAKQLNSIGIFDNEIGNAFLKNHLRNVLNDGNSILRVQDNGRIIRESLLIGPKGGLKMHSVWQGNKLITVNLFG